MHFQIYTYYIIIFLLFPCQEILPFSNSKNHAIMINTIKLSHLMMREEKNESFSDRFRCPGYH